MTDNGVFRTKFEEFDLAHVSNKPLNKEKSKEQNRLKLYAFKDRVFKQKKGK